MSLGRLRGIGVDYGTGGLRGVALAPGATPAAVAFGGPEAAGEATRWLLEAAARDAGVPVVLPSGFGVPLREAAAIDGRDLFEMTLRSGDPAAAGLGAFLAPLLRRGLRAFAIPAVKQLPTVPPHRKANRVDMGTADKLCSAAAAIWRLAGGDPARLGEVGALLLEVGAGFKAWVAVAEGRVVDGLGGTAGTVGPRARGAFDGELAYLHPPRVKAEVYAGGAADLDARFPGVGEAALWEGIEREAAMLTRFHGVARIVTAGRRAGDAAARLAARGYEAAPLPPEPGLVPAGPGAPSFEAALGAAILADGLGGGPAAALVDRLRLREATDRVTSYVWTPG